MTNTIPPLLVPPPQQNPPAAETAVDRIRRLLSLQLSNSEPIHCETALRRALQAEIGDRLTCQSNTIALFQLAVERGSVELLQELLTHHTAIDREQSWRLLRAIVDEGDARLAQAFLQSEASHLAAACDRHAHREHRPLLHVAVEQDNAELAALLLQSGLVDVNARDPDHGWTALHLAVEWDSVVVLQLLLRAGADVDAPSSDGMTPLHLAVLNGFTDSTELLIQAGACVSLVDATGATPLHVAAREGHTALLEVLIQYGADLHVRDADGRTPLHVAAFYDESAARFARGVGDTQVAVVKILLAHGADAATRDALGESALHCALKERFDVIVDVLLTHRHDDEHANARAA